MAPRPLVVNHTSAIAGAEMILLDAVAPWRNASAFLFEDGPLNTALAARGLDVITSRHGRGLAQVKRDRSLLRAAPLAGKLAAIVLELARLARRHDLVYANSQKAFVLAALATPLARRPLVWHLHDILDATHFAAAQRRLQITLANTFATAVIVPSQAAADAFVASGGKARLVTVVPNGVPAKLDPHPKAVLRAALNLPAGPLVGVFSRLAPWKGQHIVIEALTRLEGVHAVIAGDALFGEDSYAARLRALVADRGLSERVTFLGHRSDVQHLMQAVDIVIHPSVDPEPFGRTLVEAMLAETPVIATDAGAAPDILANGAAGTLVPPADADALADAIRGVLAAPDDLTPQLAFAATRAHTHYGVARMQERIAAVIDEVFSGAAPPQVRTEVST
ncbi:Glycosyltransferase [Rhodovulum sp. PH10]|uniref:glycosyltransferase n=1 Tax=Rhodovulum sp. PH10 TaxID=1187851 RepID=UPI00027C2040|nr:glycosyltransferase [Rhodovulum sp. PH10]EJW11502.1 Glycosyltransferase [Rhodovulum sp. PH10]